MILETIGERISELETMFMEDPTRWAQGCYAELELCRVQLSNTEQPADDCQAVIYDMTCNWAITAIQATIEAGANVRKRQIGRLGQPDAFVPMDYSSWENARARR